MAPLVVLALLTVCTAAARINSPTGGTWQPSGRTLLDDAQQSPLWTAVWSREPASVPAIIKAGADVDAYIHNGRTALYWAISFGDVEMVKKLLELGADPNRKTAAGNAPLHIAAHVGDALSTSLLLGKQAKVDVRSKLELTPLHHAAYGDSSQKYDREDLSFALGGHETTKEVSGDKYISPQDNLLARFQNGRLPNHIAVINLLISRGADPNAVSSVGETPLHYAPAFDRYLAANMLINAGADIEIEDDQKERPLHEAVAYGARGVVEVLLQHGADTYATEENNHNPREFICHCTSYFGTRSLNPCAPNMCMSTFDTLVIESMIDQARGA